MLYIWNMGGLGNQMFIYAFARAYQLRYGEPITFMQHKKRTGAHDECRLHELSVAKEGVAFADAKDAHGYRRSPSRVTFWIFRAIMHVIAKINPLLPYAAERVVQGLMNALGVCRVTGSYYAPVRRPLFGLPLVALGYFQSEAYFKPYQTQIRRELRVAAQPLPKNQALLNDIAKTDSVCLHVRRGDYTSPLNAMLLVCTETYYRLAVEKMLSLRPNAHFFVFSDDISWAMQSIPLPAGRGVYVNNGNTATQEIQLMYHCRHFILSNSSFSWWAQYLGNDDEKIVIAPNLWYSDKRKVDIWQSQWILVDVNYEVVS